MGTIHEFFAVTTTSLYQVTDKRWQHNWPIVEKIALRKRAKSSVSVGRRLIGGPLVGIARDGISLYDEDHPRSGRTQDPKEVNIAFIGGHTSPIVALFLKKEEAIKCLNSPKPRNCDSRWKEQTEETLKAIGDNHSVFIISKCDPISFG